VGIHYNNTCCSPENSKFPSFLTARREFSHRRFSLYWIENPLHLIGPLASGRTNRRAATSIQTTDYPGIKRSPNNYLSGNGIEKLLYLSLSNIKFKVVMPQIVAEEIREESKLSGPAEATMMSDNELLLYLRPSTSGDDWDVDHTAPKTPSYCPPTDTEEHVAEDKQNDAYGKAPIISYKRGKSLKDTLVKGKI